MPLSNPPPPFCLRPMQPEDLAAVLVIDKLAFPTPTRASVFRYELRHNELAHYQVLCAFDEVIGYSGFWMLGDECHVSTIATHPNRRGHSLGELLLLNLLFLANDRAAHLVTLEVRENNQVAQKLYHKYKFKVKGERRRYYKDTGENGLIMTVGPLDGRYHQFLYQQQRSLFARLENEDSVGRGCINHK